jgi:serine/threonine protein phosphatase PrpC
VQGVLEPSRTIGDFDVKARTQNCPGSVISIVPEVRYVDMAANRNSRDKVGLGFIVLATDGVWDFTTAMNLCDQI